MLLWYNDHPNLWPQGYIYTDSFPPMSNKATTIDTETRAGLLPPVENNASCVCFALKGQSGERKRPSTQTNIQQAGILPPVRKHASCVKFDIRNVWGSAGAPAPRASNKQAHCPLLGNTPLACISLRNVNLRQYTQFSQGWVGGRKSLPSKLLEPWPIQHGTAVYPDRWKQVRPLAQPASLSQSSV